MARLTSTTRRSSCQAASRCSSSCLRRISSAWRFRSCCRRDSRSRACRCVGCAPRTRPSRSLSSARRVVQEATRRRGLRSKAFDLRCLPCRFAQPLLRPALRHPLTLLCGAPLCASVVQRPLGRSHVGRCGGSLGPCRFQAGGQGRATRIELSGPAAQCITFRTLVQHSPFGGQPDHAFIGENVAGERDDPPAGQERWREPDRGRQDRAARRRAPGVVSPRIAGRGGWRR